MKKLKHALHQEEIWMKQRSRVLFTEKEDPVFFGFTKGIEILHTFTDKLLNGNV
jgi:hypothetical protein